MIYLTGDLNKFDVNWAKALRAARVDILNWPPMKTLILYNFTHIEAIVPNPPKDFINKLEKLLVKFINGGRQNISKKHNLHT